MDKDFFCKRCIATFKSGLYVNVKSHFLATPSFIVIVFFLFLISRLVVEYASTFLVPLIIIANDQHDHRRLIPYLGDKMSLYTLLLVDFHTFGKKIHRTWQINRINNTNRINNGLINRCKLGSGSIHINAY